jgi:hypothetical protein
VNYRLPLRKSGLLEENDGGLRDPAVAHEDTDSEQRIKVVSGEHFGDVRLKTRVLGKPRMGTNRRQICRELKRLERPFFSKGKAVRSQTGRGALRGDWTGDEDGGVVSSLRGEATLDEDCSRLGLEVSME